MPVCKDSDVLKSITLHRPLPVLHAKAPRLLQAVMNSELEIDQLTGIVEQFPSIAARLVYLANSAWSSPNNQITSIRDACIRLGFSTVKTVSIGLAVSSSLDPSRCPLFNGRQYWASALLMAETVDLLIPHLKNPNSVDPATLRSAALLANLGLLCMADRLPDKTNLAFERVRDNPRLSLQDTLRECVSTDYCAVGACLADALRLPPPLAESMAYHRDLEYQGSECCTVQLVGLARSLLACGSKENRNPHQLRCPEALQLDNSQLNIIAGQSSERMQATYDLADAMFFL